MALEESGTRSVPVDTASVAPSQDKSISQDAASASTAHPSQDQRSLPRVTLTYCTQCKWLLRAAYYAQELLSTFGTDLGEVVLRPNVGGVFTVDIDIDAEPHHDSDARVENGEIGLEAGRRIEGGIDQVRKIQRQRIWDRKVDGGFPETKILKRRVRDIIAPERELGHVDRDHTVVAVSKDKDKDSHKDSQGKENDKPKGNEANSQQQQQQDGIGFDADSSSTAATLVSGLETGIGLGEKPSTSTTSTVKDLGVGEGEARSKKEICEDCV